MQHLRSIASFSCYFALTSEIYLETDCVIASHPGGDQGLLNTYWGDWATKDIKYHLPFIYNMVANAHYGYAPAFQR